MVSRLDVAEKRTVIVIRRSGALPACGGWFVNQHTPRFPLRSYLFGGSGDIVRLGDNGLEDDAAGGQLGEGGGVESEQLEKRL